MAARKKSWIIERKNESFANISKSMAARKKSWIIEIKNESFANISKSMAARKKSWIPYCVLLDLQQSNIYYQEHDVSLMIYEIIMHS